eukprot:TRINITY_DN10740_c0_g1_i1.p1 TRINITY_DN10740_c0_g1~~TRINITY_DN10740_c0_g1_i1.p1  ORF type:complete len:829 (+),score=140.22 TRINITY_DN10740_c0_g1_i1:360-2489(+)
MFVEEESESESEEGAEGEVRQQAGRPVVMPPPPPPADDGAAAGAPQGEDEDEDDPNEPLRVGEFIGLSGPLSGIFLSVGTVLCYNLLFLSTTIAIPSVVGKLTRLLIGVFLGLLPFSLNSESEIISVSANEMGGIAMCSVEEGLLPFQSFVGGMCPRNDLLSSPKQSMSSIHLVLLGYLVLLLPSALIFIWIYFKKQRGETLSYLQGMSSSILVLSYSVLKSLSLLLFEFLVFPTTVGFFLWEICARASGTSNLLLESNYGLMVDIACFYCGFVFLLGISLTVRAMRKALRPGVLWFFRDVEDPTYSILNETVLVSLSYHARRYLFSAIFYVILMWSIVYVPLVVINYCYGLLGVSIDPFAMSGAYLSIINFFAPMLLSLFATSYICTSISMRRYLQLWFSDVGRVFKLSSYFFTTETKRDGTTVTHDPFTPPSSKLDKFVFGLKICGLLFVMWLTYFWNVFAAATVPVLLSKLPIPFSSAFADVSSSSTVAGSVYMFVLTGCAAVLRGQEGTTTSLLQRVFAALRFAFVAITFTLYIPLMAGIWLHLFGLDLARGDFNQCIVRSFDEIYISGILWLAFLCLETRDAHVPPQLREGLRELYRGGLHDINFMSYLNGVLKEIIWYLGHRLTVPLFLVRAVLPYIATIFPSLALSEDLLDILSKFSYQIYAGTLFLLLLLPKVVKASVAAHDTVRDEQYLLGRRLVNIARA